MSLLIGLGVAGTILAGITGMLVAGYVGHRRDWPHTLPQSGAIASEMPWDPERVDALVMAQIEAYDHEMANAPGTSRGAMKAVRLKFFVVEGERALPQYPDMAGRALRPAALQLEAAVLPDDDVGHTAIGYEVWRRLRRYHGHSDWDANNRKGSPSRWPTPWFKAIGAADELFRELLIKPAPK